MSIVLTWLRRLRCARLAPCGPQERVDFPHAWERSVPGRGARAVGMRGPFPMDAGAPPRPLSTKFTSFSLSALFSKSIAFTGTRISRIVRLERFLIAARRCRIDPIGMPSTTRRATYHRQIAFAVYDADDSRESVEPSLKIGDAKTDRSVSSNSRLTSPRDADTIADSEEGETISTECDEEGIASTQINDCAKIDPTGEGDGLETPGDCESLRSIQPRDDSATSLRDAMMAVRKHMCAVQKCLHDMQTRIGRIEIMLHARAECEAGHDRVGLPASEPSQVMRGTCSVKGKKRRCYNGTEREEVVPDSQEAMAFPQSDTSHHGDESTEQEQPAKRRCCGPSCRK